jgi:hypothetical protein
MLATLKALLIIKHIKCKELKIAGKISVARLLAPWEPDDDQQQGGDGEEEKKEHANTTTTSHKK